MRNTNINIIPGVRDPREIGLKDRSRSARRMRQHPRTPYRVRDEIADTQNHRRKLRSFMAIQEPPIMALTERQPQQPCLTPQAVTAEELAFYYGVLFAPRSTEESGDLTTAHFVRHTAWQEQGDDSIIEELLAENLLPGGYGQQFAEVEDLLVMPSRTARESCYAIKDDGKPGARMPIATQRARWHTHVRERRPDSDE